MQYPPKIAILNDTKTKNARIKCTDDTKIKKGLHSKLISSVATV